MKTLDEVLAFTPNTVKEIRENNSDLIYYRNFKEPFRVSEINDKLKVNYNLIKSIWGQISIIKDKEFKGKVLFLRTYYYTAISFLLLLCVFIWYKYC